MASWRKLGVILAAAISVAAVSLPVLADGRALGGQANCRVAAPHGWSERHIRWTGACRAGRAEGPGVLREFEHGTVKRFFFGRLQAGRIVLGAIEQPDGYVAGRFQAGRVVTGGGRNTLIKAFDEAAAAARQVADGYRKAGNSASASYYQYKAEQLAKQLD